MPRELDRCVEKVKRRGGVRNAFAVCRASLGTDKAIKARRGRRKRSKAGGSRFDHT